MTGYSVSIENASKELRKKERVMLKDTSDALKLDDVIQGEPIIINPDYWVMLMVHNEKSDNVDYPAYLIMDKNGTKYVTGSEAFWTTFSDIWDEMTEDGDEEEWQLKCYKLDSKNFKGKQFLTCSVI
nr:MAG: Single-stranded DNA-binding protein [Bacteriophage sp.]